MAIANFGSGSNITVAGFSATVLNPGAYAEEFPVSESTPITQTEGHRQSYFGLVKTVDPITVEIQFDPEILIPTSSTIISGSTVYTINSDSTATMTITGTAAITRFELGELTHENIQMATITVQYQGGSTAITHLAATQ